MKTKFPRIHLSNINISKLNIWNNKATSSSDIMCIFEILNIRVSHIEITLAT